MDGLSVQEHSGQWVLCSNGKRLKGGPAPHNSTGKWVYPETHYFSFATKEEADAYISNLQVTANNAQGVTT